MPKMAMFHDDDCGEFLSKDGLCRKCNFHPDMQSTGYKAISEGKLIELGSDIIQLTSSS